MSISVKTFFLLVIAGLHFFFTAGVGDATDAERLSVQDALGRTVTVVLPVNRLVIMNSDALEVVRSLGCADRIVGVFSEIQRDPVFWGHLLERPKVGSWRDPNAEKIAALAPDVVIAYERNPGRQFDKKFEALKIPVLRLNFYKLRTLASEISTLGKVLQCETEAGKLRRWHQDVTDRIEERTTAVGRRPTVYLESYSALHACGPGSGSHEICELAGGINIAEGLAIPFSIVTPEWVLAQNPAVIVKPSTWSGGYMRKQATPLNRIRDEISARSAWRHIRAVETGRVHVVDSSVWTGPRAVIGMAFLAKWIHPALFMDLDPTALHREYMETFQRIPYQGVYVSDSRKDTAQP